MPSAQIHSALGGRKLNFALALVSLALASCGGGDADQSEAPIAAAPAPSPTPPAPPAPAPTPPAPTPPSPAAADSPTVSALGTAEGFSVVETVGPAGGTVLGAGGRVEIVIPPGALAAPTEITIQPITNTMPNGIGQAYRLGPEGVTFAVPVKIKFNAIPDDLNGTDLSYLDLLAQTSDGTWEAHPSQVTDVGTGSVTVESMHFSDWGTQARYYLTPASATLSFREQLTLTLRECGYIDTPNPPVKDPTTGELKSNGTYKALTCKGSTSALLDQWQLNGNDAAVSAASLGTLLPTNAARAGYQAPDQVPSGNPVVASARLQAEGKVGTPRLSAKITIVDKPGYSLYAERTQKLTDGTSTQVISSVAAGQWTYSALQSTANQASTWQPRGRVNIAYKVTNPVCTTSLRGGADFDDALTSNALLQIPGSTKLSFGASVLQVTLTGTSVCTDSPEKAVSLTIDWPALVSADQSPDDALVAPDANGKLAGSNRWSPQGSEVVTQTFKFEPVGR
jgi:hypothetical protein